MGGFVATFVILSILAGGLQGPAAPVGEIAADTPAGGPAGAPLGLYGMIGGHLVRVDEATAEVTEIGSTPATGSFEALTFDPRTGTLYGIIDGTTDPKLVTVDRASGAVAAVGPIDIVEPAADLHLAEALAFSPADGLLYAAVSEIGVPHGGSRSETLAIVDPCTGEAREVAEFSGVEEADAREFVGGTLYVSNTAPPRTFLYRVDPATAVSSLVGEVGFNNVADLAFDAESGTLFGTAHTERLLLSISMETGRGTAIGPTHTPGEFEGMTLTAIAAAPLPSSPIRIDIKPGSDPNSINLRNHGVIPVALLSDDAFDATAVDAGRLAFGPGAALEAHGIGHPEDVDGDGDTDLVLHFRTQEAGIPADATEACLAGVLPTGESFSACDAVRIVPP